jgi:ribosome-associated protein
MTEGIELAKACALAADENKAEDIKVLDVRGLSPITDFVVICSGTSLPHLKAIMRDIGKNVQESLNEEPHSSDGSPDARWVVLDYVDVMVHVMLEDMRSLYALEDLWESAATVEWEN